MSGSPTSVGDMKSAYLKSNPSGTWTSAMQLGAENAATQMQMGNMPGSNMNMSGMSGMASQGSMQMPSGGSGNTFAWTTTDYGVATSTTLGFLNGFISTASSTIDSNLTITGNSTTTAAGRLITSGHIGTTTRTSRE